MSSIFKKLSVILCCLFGLISINPVTLAKPGDYLVYFFNINKCENTLRCGKCAQCLNFRAGQFCCPNHCAPCGVINEIEATKAIKTINFACCSSCVPGSVPRCAFHLMEQYGPFCFIKYENGGKFDTVFQDAKNSGELYCAYCMAKELKGNFDGQIFVNVPKTTYSVPAQSKKDGRKLESEILFEKVFKLDGIDDIDDNVMCPKCYECDNLFEKERDERGPDQQCDNHINDRLYNRLRSGMSKFNNKFNRKYYKIAKLAKLAIYYCSNYLKSLQK